MGLIGVGLEAFAVPLGPVVLGLILGDEVERYFIQSMTKTNGDFSGFFARPVSCALGVACIVIWVAPLLASTYRLVRAKGSTTEQR
jgi:putative tricarboxylic transport membrane protein